MPEFSDLGSFMVHFAASVRAVDIATHKALDKAATIIEKDAKNRIGHYQEAEGPHPAWAPLADSTIEERSRLGFTPDDPLLRTGKLRDSIQSEIRTVANYDSTQEAIIGSKLEVAEIQEFGTSRIPARPFLGPAAFANKDKIQNLLGEAVVKGLFSGGQVHEALGYDIDT